MRINSVNNYFIINKIITRSTMRSATRNSTTATSINKKTKSQVSIPLCSTTSSTTDASRDCVTKPHSASASDTCRVIGHDKHVSSRLLGRRRLRRGVATTNSQLNGAAREFAVPGLTCAAGAPASNSLNTINASACCSNPFGFSFFFFGSEPFFGFYSY